MRILQISSAVNFGGGERHWADLCAGLARREYEIFAALRFGCDWRKELAFLPDENISRLPLRNSIDVLSARRIARLIKEKNIEIVHAHLARDYPVAALAARMSNAKLVLTRHLTFPINSFHKVILPENVVFIAVSKAVRRSLLEKNIAAPERIRLVYNGVDARRFAAYEKGAGKEILIRKYNLPRGSLLVGILGEIAAHKGQADFVRAAAVVLKRFPAAEFFIAGRDVSPRRKNENDLKSLIEESGLTKKIHFPGWLENAAPFLSALDVFVSASHYESFGLATVEAMAAGAAIVATETGGARETVENGATGKLVPVENPAALAESIIEFLSDENARRAFGSRAQIRAAEKFSVEKMIAETEKLYREL